MKILNDLLTPISVRILIHKGNFDVKRMESNALKAKEVNEKLLFNILEKNKDTEYGKKYNFDKIQTIEEYRKYVPICEYKDIEEYVERIYNNNEQNVLTSREVIGFAKSSGSVGKTKTIPKTKIDTSVYERYTVTKFLALANQKLKEIKGKGIKPRKGISLLLHDPTLNDNGLPSSNVADIAEKKYRLVEPYFLILPIGRQFTVGEIERNYAFSRFGLEYKDCAFIFFVFAKGITEFIEYIRDNWQSLVNEIETGTLSEKEKINAETRKQLQAIIKPNPKRANELRKEFEKGFDETILKRIWPNLSVISTIGTSVSFEGFIEEIKKYSKDVFIDYSIYGASEGLMAAAFEPNNKEQVLLPDSCYYEFIEEDDEEAKRIYAIDELEVGKKYEVVLTNQSGFYRYRIKDVIVVMGYYKNCPTINFVYRKGQLLNINGEKTTIEHMNEALKRLSKLTNIDITNWAVDVEKGDRLFRYAIYVENEQEKDLSQYSKELDQILCEVNFAYRQYKFTIENPRIINQKYGTHKEWQEYKIKNGAPPSQVKPVKNLDTQEKYDFFTKRIIK